jgi:molybdopterin converting factor small subunit
VSVTVLLPGVLAEVAGGSRRLRLDPAPADVGALLDALAADHPLLVRRLRDETGALRRHVNVYVDGDDVRGMQGLRTPLPAGAEVHVLPSVAGG